MADYVVRPGNARRDGEAVVALWTRNLRSHDAHTHRQKFEWYYERNPIGPGRFWVLEHDAGGPVVGVAGLGLRRLRMGDRTLTAGLASDFAVDKEHRSLRPAMLLARAVAASIDNGLDFIYGLPNSQSVGVFKRIGYNTDGKLRRYVKVLRVERFLRRRVRRPLVRKGLAGIIDSAIRVVSTETWQPVGGRMVREIPSIDDRFDLLWSRAAMGRRAVMERGGAYLKWRYQDCPLAKYTFLTLAAPNDRELLGYAVCLVRNDGQALIVDLFGGTSAETRDSLIAGIIRWARARGLASVACSVHGQVDTEAALRRFGFRLRLPETPVAILTRVGGPSLSDLRDWYFLLADEDYN